MSGDRLLEVRGLVKHFPISGSRNKVQALNDVSFSIASGETVSLVGESGSGKTTIGRCVTGLLAPTSGEILFRDKLLGPSHNIRSPALRGKIQLVFQEPAEALNPRMQVGDIVAEPLVYMGTSRPDREQLAIRALAEVGLPPAIGQLYPNELSAGFQQRVGIARAIVTKPELIVLDEPTSALDPTARSEIVDLLMDIQKRLGTAYLFISHDLSTVRHLSDKVLVLYLGSIMEEACADVMFREPLHPYSNGLIAAALLPHPSLKPEQRLVLKGEIPSPINLPAGCPLAARCPFASERCGREKPPGDRVKDQHVVHCFHHDQVEAMGRGPDLFKAFQKIAGRVLNA